MDRKKRYIDSPCIRQLIDKGRIPMLFIGSGISKRYVKNYPSWDELIQFVASKIDVSNGQLLAMKQEITDTLPYESKGKINAEIGSKLTRIFREKVLNGEIKLEDIFTEEEIHKIEAENITFVKMLISKRLLSYELTANKRYLNEFNEFKKLRNNIGAVITTNYDKFLEKEIFNNFDVFVEQSQYYMTDCVGIGEVYKIHGSVETPNSLIFNSEDYKNFEDNLRVVAAKLLSLALEYPIVFLGYSLEDDNILAIFETLVSSLNKKQLEELSKNLIYVEWKSKEFNLSESKKTITRNGKFLEYTCITTDNFFVLFKYLLKFTPAEKPERVRKYKKMIQHLIVSSNGGEATIIAEDNLDKLKNDGKLVVAFGQRERFAQKGVIGIGTEDIIKWVLEQENDIPKDYANSIFKDFYLKSRISSNYYIPMFYIAKFTDDYKDNGKLLTMKSNLENWVERINFDKNIISFNSFEEIRNSIDSMTLYKCIQSIVKSYYNNSINYAECLTLLKELYSNESLIIKNSDFRKAIAYLDLKQ